MLKRNLSPFLTILAMMLLLLSTYFSELDFNSKESWMNMAALAIIIVSILGIIHNESKNKSKS